MRQVALILTVLLICIAASADQQATTPDGRSVILHDDGTWQYVETPEARVPGDRDDHDCANWIRTRTDKVSGVVMVTSKSSVVVSSDRGSKALSISVMATPAVPEVGEQSEGLILSIRVTGAGACVDKGDRVDILFTDGTRMELAHRGDFNCKAKSIVYFGGLFGHEKELRTLGQKKVETMRVWTTDSYVQEDFSDEAATALMYTIRCLSKP